jgi:alginate O-acetyltransferase complex protein AlgI
LSITSLQFLIALFAGSAVFTALNALWLRRVFVTLVSAVFLWLLAPDVTHLVTLFAFVLSGFVIARLLIWRPSTLLMAGYLIGLTIAFVILKQYAFLRLVAGDSLVAHGLDLIGLSFIFFRQIHVIVDVKQSEIRDLTLWSYLCYQFNLFTLLAGPIQRYQRFNEDWQTLTPTLKDAHEVRVAILRILIGVIKVAVIADACLELASRAYVEPEVFGGWARVVRFYFFPAYVYFNFTGYCDIVISGAALAGLRVPENFDRPYLARNMIDYWTRWHRTLSFWIRDYIFTPLYMAIARRQPKSAPRLVFLCYFIALFLAGVWHGATWNFVAFGVLNGIGVSAAKIWENWIVAHYGRQGLRNYLASKPIKWIARVSTLHFACLTMFFLQPESVLTMIKVWGKLLELMSAMVPA